MMKHRYIFISALVVSFPLILSCNKDEHSTASVSENLITFSPVLDASETKGTMITGTDFGNRDFKAACWTDDAASGSYTKQFDYTKVKKLSFTHADTETRYYWSTVDEANSDAVLEKFWKGTGASKTKVNKKFYAYTNLPTVSGAAEVTTASSANQTLTYDVEKVPTAAAQTDILLGYYSGNGVKPTHGTSKTDYVGWAAPINFRHPLSAIKFQKGTITDWINGTDKITDISISGVYKKGTCTDNGSFSWGSFSGSGNVGMSSSTGLTIGTGDIIGETFFLIPQTFAAATITISVSLTVGGTAYSTAATLSADEWMAGKYYTYTLNYTAGYSPVLSVSLADWGEIKTNADMEDGSVLGYDDPNVNPWSNGTTGNVNYTD